MSTHKRRNKYRESKPNVTTAQPSEEVASKGWLVATEEKGVCVLFAPDGSSIDRSLGEFEDFPLMFPETLSDLSAAIDFHGSFQQRPVSVAQTVGQSAATANLAVQVTQAVYQAQGLVRLSPETLALLDGGAKTLQSSGWNIGTLSATNGQFVGTVQWLPAGAAMPLAVAASAGFALTLMALQWQLGRIEKQTQKMLGVVNNILQEIREDQRNDVIARVKRLQDAMTEAKAVGAVTRAVWGGINPEMENQLDRLRLNAENRVYPLIADLVGKSSLKERLEWMNEKGADLVHDIIMLTEVFGGLYRYWVLRIGYILNTKDESDITIAGTLKENATHRLAEIRDKLVPLTEELWRYFSLITECPGALGMTVWGRKKRQEAVNAAYQFREVIANLYEKFTGQVLKEPAAIKNLPESLSSVRWLLIEDEYVFVSFEITRPLLPVLKNQRFFSTFVGSRQFEYTLIMTNQRLIILQNSEFQKNCLFYQALENSSVQYIIDQEEIWVRMQIRVVSGSNLEPLAYEILFEKENFPPHEAEDFLAKMKIFSTQQSPERVAEV
jgi:hypothetical protein